MGFTFKFVTRRLLRLPDGSDFPARRAGRHLGPLRPRHPARDPAPVPLRPAAGAGGGGRRPGKLTCPSLVVWGDADPYLPVSSPTTTPPPWAARPRSRSWRAQATGPGSATPRWSTAWPRSWPERPRAALRSVGVSDLWDKLERAYHVGIEAPGKETHFLILLSLVITFGIVRADHPRHPQRRLVVARRQRGDQVGPAHPPHGPGHPAADVQRLPGPVAGAREPVARAAGRGLRGRAGPDPGRVRPVAEPGGRVLAAAGARVGGRGDRGGVAAGRHVHRPPVLGRRVRGPADHRRHEGARGGRHQHRDPGDRPGAGRAAGRGRHLQGQAPAGAGGRVRAAGRPDRRRAPGQAPLALGAPLLRRRQEAQGGGALRLRADRAPVAPAPAGT